MDPLAALVDWVEKGEAPTTLDGARLDENGATTAAQPICPYPTVARWDGQGDPTTAASISAPKRLACPAECRYARIASGHAVEPA